MTIDEAIKFRDEKSKNIKLKAEPQVFIQLAEWLEELKANKDTSAEIYESGYKRGYREGYTKAVDDFADRLSKYLDVENATKYGNENAEQQIKSYDTLMKYEIAWAIDDVAEQLKGGGSDG